MSSFEENAAPFQRQADAIRSAMASERLAHAYMLHGDDEAARWNFSVLIAQTASCPKAETDGTPCLSCQVCRQIADRSYPELFILEPISKSRRILVGKNDDDVGTMRWLLNQLSLSSVAPGMRKIGLILDADRLGTQSQNAFLKTLEEPPDGTILILATANQAALLPTIVSRCHMVSILKNRMEYAFPGVENVAEAMARLGSCATGGGLRAAMESHNELMDILNSLEDEAEKAVSPAWDGKIEDLEEFVATLPAAARKDFKTRVKTLKDARDAAARGELTKRTSELCSFVHAWFAQIYQVALGVEPAELANPDIFSHFDIRRLAGNDTNSAANNLRRTEKLLDDLRWNVDRKLAVAAFCCSFVEDAANNAKST